MCDDGNQRDVAAAKAREIPAGQTDWRRKSCGFHRPLLRLLLLEANKFELQAAGSSSETDNSRARLASGNLSARDANCCRLDGQRSQLDMK